MTDVEDEPERDAVAADLFAEVAGWRRQLAEQVDTTDDEIRRADQAEAKLARIEALCDASDSEGDITVRDVRAILSGKTPA